MTGIGVVSAIFWLLALVWLFRRKTMLLYFFPFTGLMLLFSQVYKIWHEGILFVLLIFVLWVSYPSGKEADFATNPVGRCFHIAFLVALGCTLSVHLIWGLKAIQYDRNHIFSGSKACADALKRLKLDDGKLYIIGYNCIGVQPYFDRNLFVNTVAPNHGTFWFWSVRNPLARNMATPGQPNLIQALTVNSPRYALVGVYDRESQVLLDKILKETIYSIKGSFKGSTGWKGDPYEPDDLFLLGKGN